MRGSWKRSFDLRGLKSWEPERLEYLIYLSIMNRVDPVDLLEGLFDAEKRGSIICGPLKILVRERANDHTIFLLTKDTQIVAQMSIKSIIWENPAKTRRLYSRLVDDIQQRKKMYLPPSTIIELQRGMKNIHLRVKVTEKSETMIRYSRYNGTPVNLCVAKVTDVSGSIRLPLWNDQINEVSIGDEIDIKNAHVNAFQGLLQIEPSRKLGEIAIIKSLKPVDTK